MATAKEIAVPVADPCTFKADSIREFLSLEGGPGRRSDKEACPSTTWHSEPP